MVIGASGARSSRCWRASNARLRARVVRTGAADPGRRGVDIDPFCPGLTGRIRPPAPEPMPLGGTGPGGRPTRRDAPSASISV